MSHRLRCSDLPCLKNRRVVFFFLRGIRLQVAAASANEQLYKPPMNPCVVSSCLRTSLRFPYATPALAVLAYAAVSEHVKLTHRLGVGVLSASPQEFLTRAPFLMQQNDVDDSEEEDDEELPSRLSAAWRCCSYCRSRNMFCSSGIHREGWRAAELGELMQILRRLRELTRPSPFSFPNQRLQKPFCSF